MGSGQMNPRDNKPMSVQTGTKKKEGGFAETVRVVFHALIIALVIRTFLFQPFNIPSGSMIPTLLVGDYLFVSKYSYGYTHYSFPFSPPIYSGRILGSDLHRGDVVVFRLPKDDSIDYIKRVVGLPGDEVSYLNKQLRINGQLIVETPKPDYFVEGSSTYEQAFEEDLSGVKHQILTRADRPGYIQPFNTFEFKENCRYSAEGVVCKVPAGHYFMMGDHRDDSEDSRFWGFVPDENIVGRAFFVWMNFGDLGRIGSFH
jgi:signal peptidase I